MSAASSVELEQTPPRKIDLSYQRLIKQLQETPSDQVFNVSLKWKRDTKATFVGNGATVAYKRFIWGLLTNIIDNIKQESSLYDMEMMSKIISFFTTWEEDGYPGIVVINKEGIDAEIYNTYYAILLALYESRGKRGSEKMVDPSIFVNADGSLNLGNTPIMAMLRDMIRGCKRGIECDRGNKDHLTFMHRLPVSPDIRTIYGYSSTYPVKGGRRRQTRYGKKRKASKHKTQKKSKKQRS
jgi:hypothetical protein